MRCFIKIRERNRIIGIRVVGEEMIWSSVRTLAFTPSDKGNHWSEK